MDDERQTLEEKVDELRKTLARLEEEWETYCARVSRMTVSKLTDPRHRLVDWELLYLPSKAQQARFRATMQALQNRVTDTPTPEREQIEVDGLSRETLYAPTPPTLDEVLHALQIVTGQGERGIIDIMQAAKEEFDIDYGDLADFVLDAINLQR